MNFNTATCILSSETRAILRASVVYASTAKFAAVAEHALSITPATCSNPTQRAHTYPKFYEKNEPATTSLFYFF
jgi:hypothetical protein